MSSFLEEFDRRARQQAPGQAPAPPADLPPEDRELLEFADLIRAKRALPPAGEGQRLRERVRAAEVRRGAPSLPVAQPPSAVSGRNGRTIHAQPGLGAEVPHHSARRHSLWFLAAAAAVLCFGAGLWWGLRPKQSHQARSVPPAERGKGSRSTSRRQRPRAASPKRRSSSPARSSPRARARTRSKRPTRRTSRGCSACADW